MRLVHYDVGKRREGPMALCHGGEHGVCAGHWADVTCDACLRLPLADDATERRARERAAIEPLEPDREPEGPEIP